MQCQKVRQIYQDVKIPPCCESCHDDADTGHGDDLYFNIDGRQLHVCCVIGRAFEDKEVNKNQEYLDRLSPLDPRDQNGEQMSEQEKGKKKLSALSVAMTILLRDRLAANPDYKASDLDAEMDAFAAELGAKRAKK